jgi:hypothetical protein
VIILQLALSEASLHAGIGRVDGRATGSLARRQRGI